MSRSTRRPAPLFLAGVVTLGCLLAVPLRAQDSRVVTEPSFPPPCATLGASQVTGSLDETSFDTARVQAALDGCRAGQAVVLTTEDGDDAFLIQPITIPSGVTLIVDADVTVFTSLNRADYPCPGPGSSDCTAIITVLTRTSAPAIRATPSYSTSSTRPPRECCIRTSTTLPFAICTCSIARTRRR